MENSRSEVDDEDILRIFALSPDPVLSAPEIAEELPITNQAVNKRLRRMERDGILTSKKVGSAAKIYWLTDKGRAQLADMGST